MFVLIVLWKLPWKLYVKFVIPLTSRSFVITSFCYVIGWLVEEYEIENSLMCETSVLVFLYIPDNG